MGTIGVVGLGLLGRGIAATLAAAGYDVIAYSRSAPTRDAALEHARQVVGELREHGASADVSGAMDRLRVVDALRELATCAFVIESVIEDTNVKRGIFDELEEMLGPETPIASNTSALPITLLQRDRKRPGRFVGMHWGEPCHISRFLEVIRGDLTDDTTFEATVRLGYACGKEPSLVQKDVPGFITNRLMYAMLREAIHLLESGVGDVETIDRSFRNDIGFWATIAGPFRWMDLTGIPAYARVMKDLLPHLANGTHLPETMRRIVDSGAEGIGNARGFYPYTEAEAKRWAQVWNDFTWDVRELADEYVPVAPPHAPTPEKER